MENIAKDLRYKRKQAVLTQDELAERSGVSVGTIRKIESGKLTIDLSKLIAVCKAINCEVKVHIISKN